MTARPRKYFAGFCPTPYEKSVVLGGGLVLFPIEDPARAAATLHLYTQQLWDAAYAEGRQDVQSELKRSLGL